MARPLGGGGPLNGSLTPFSASHAAPSCWRSAAIRKAQGATGGAVVHASEILTVEITAAKLRDSSLGH